MSLFSSRDFSPADAARLHRIERKLDLIIKHLGIRDDEGSRDGLLDEVHALADAGRKIEAIKRHRQLTGSSLVEAKAAVEDYMYRGK
jgi:hypothetical protein